MLTFDSPPTAAPYRRRWTASCTNTSSMAAPDASTRVVVITAMGRTFCAGADLSDPPVSSGPGPFAAVLRGYGLPGRPGPTSYQFLAPRR